MKNHYLIRQYFPFFYNDGMRKEVLPKEDFSFLDMYIPLLRFLKYSNLYEVLSDLKNTCPVVRGYNARELNWNGKNLDDIDTIKFSYCEESKELFCNYLKQCKDDSIKVIFVYTPFYIEGTNKVSNIQEYYDFFDSIANSYDCTILDYLHLPICYDTTYFYNAMHLNKKGAEKFSRILAHDLDSLHLFENKF